MSDVIKKVNEKLFPQVRMWLVRDLVLRKVRAAVVVTASITTLLLRSANMFFSFNTKL